jgi:D-xylonolactonase
VLVDRGFTVNGVRLQEQGGFLTTSSEGAWMWHPGEKPIPLAREADSQECRLNDCFADPKRHVCSGSYHLNPDGASSPSYLFRIDTDGAAHVADEGICFSNGLAFSPDGGTLYFTDMVARCVYAYSWSRPDGALSNRRVFVHIDRAEGMPDGLTVDAEGFLWIAHWFGGCVTRYDPDGKRERG